MRARMFPVGLATLFLVASLGCPTPTTDGSSSSSGGGGTSSGGGASSVGGSSAGGGSGGSSSHGAASSGATSADGSSAPVTSQGATSAAVSGTSGDPSSGATSSSQSGLSSDNSSTPGVSSSDGGSSGGASSGPRPALLNADPAIIDFGVLPQGGTATQQVRVTNVSGQMVRLGVVSVETNPPAGATIAPNIDNVVLGEGGETTFTVHWTQQGFDQLAADKPTGAGD